MDVRLKFKKEEKEYDDRTCIIVVEIENICIGLIIYTPDYSSDSICLFNIVIRL